MVQRKKSYGVSPAEFCAAWQIAHSADEVVEQLKMPKAIAIARASSYRRRGVKLKPMPRANRKLDLDLLGRMLADINKDYGVDVKPSKRDKLLLDPHTRDRIIADIVNRETPPSEKPLDSLRG